MEVGNEARAEPSSTICYGGLLGHKKTFAQLLIMLDDMTRFDDNVLQIMHVEGALRVRNMVS